MLLGENLLKNRKFVFLGIGGVGVSALCIFVKQNGGEVFGYDRDLTSETVIKLQASGVFVTDNVENLPSCNVCVYSNAVPKSLRFAVQAEERYSRGEFLGKILSLFPTTVAVSGSHGKTTTVAMLGEILYSSPSTVFLGGEYSHFEQFCGYGNFYANGNAVCVCEACEYCKNFLQLKPSIAVALNVDSDHMDCYRDFSDIAATFSTFLKNAAISVINADDPTLAAFPATVSYGVETEADYRAINLKSNGGRYSFDCLERGRVAARISLAVMGHHQVYNALAAIAVARQLFVPFSVIAEKLHAFTGVSRRGESLGKKNGMELIADYAHHPSEISAFVSAFQESTSKPFSILFQPHTYSRTNYLFKEFCKVLSKYSSVAIARTYAAREQPVSEQEEWLLAKQVGAKELASDYDIFKYLEEETEKGRVVLVLGAGDIYQKVKTYLQREECPNGI